MLGFAVNADPVNHLEEKSKLSFRKKPTVPSSRFLFAGKAIGQPTCKEQ
jgi:hypothetical protein